MNTVLSITWRIFTCRRCGHIISECKPSGLASNAIPTIEEIDACALCAHAAKSRP